ncbi:MAG: polyprenyl synthetase family protein [Clostridia bacterium]|nr:polyprenyl synthetase family protein [Clostridia bacterium]
MNKLETALIACADRVTDSLRECLTAEDPTCEPLFEAMRYSALSAGKRIRPYLTVEFCRLFGGREEAAMPFACAVEMIHNYSLIHDDLPCMDNDDFRRGKPTNHKVYGETTALLAGDTLLTQAFATCASNAYVSPASVQHAVAYLAKAAGGVGMAGGQMIDTAADGKLNTREALEHMYRLKTGALIAAASVLGVYAATDAPTAEMLKDTETFSYNVGLAFQFMDDVLDVTADAEEFGRPTGSDDKNQKTTILSFLTMEDTLARVRSLTEEAVAIISKYPDSENLISLANYLVTRRK